MFSGIVKATGIVKQVLKNQEGKDIIITSTLDQTGFMIGDSISVNGCCLTIVEHNGKEMKFYASGDTLKKTTITMLGVGSVVNLEPAMKLSDRIGGHIVSGHVDETARIVHIETIGADRKLKLEVSNYGKNLVFQRGSIAVDGVSLTIAYVSGNIVTLNIIPHTWENTILKYINIHTNFLVNVEYDQIAKHTYKVVKNLIMR